VQLLLRQSVCRHGSPLGPRWSLQHSFPSKNGSQVALRVRSLVRCPQPFGAATKGTAGSPARAGWRPAHPSPDPPAPVGPPQLRRAATPEPRPTPLTGNLFRRASRSGPTHAAPRPRRRCRPASTSPEARRPLAPTLAVDPAQPSLATAAGPPPIPAPGPLHRVVPQRSTLLLLPRVSPKIAGLRHPNRAPRANLWEVRPGCNDITPANPRTPECRGRRDRHGLSPCL
jgi:hypothetical protein